VSLPVVYRRAAAFDIQGAFRRYESERPGLGIRFLDEIARIEAHVSAAPALYQRVDDDARRAVLRRFPFGVFYVVEPERILVLACLDLRGDPRMVEDILYDRRH
jgi:hypothetical protein